MNKQYEQQLLTHWEDVFKQGLLTFWVFVALHEHARSVSELKLAVEDLTDGTYVAAEQTLYRLLRKQYDLELVDFVEVESPNGPNRKLYSLSPLGTSLLHEFTRKNIGLFFQSRIKKIVKENI